MRSGKRQNKITEQKKIQKEIQKEICQGLLIFLTVSSVMCTVTLTGCRDKKSAEQTELISLDGRDTDTKKADGNTEQDVDAADEKTADAGTEQAGSGQKNEKGKAGICYVHVCGAVKAPGVYGLTADSRLFEAIQMAGGLTEEAAGEALNQAQLVEDGSRIYVPTKEEAKAGMENGGTFAQNAENGKTEGADGTAAGNPADDRVNINTAAKDELMTLPGIGEAKAEAVIRYREEHGGFQKIEDLMEVEGIKEGVFQKVKDQIKV